MIITLFGIPNCNQVKQARVWLETNAIAYRFHDFKKAGLAKDVIDGWLCDLSWDVLINRKGTTWRKLSEERRAATIDRASATTLMLEHPSIIKRPVLVLTDGVCTRSHIGFADDIYRRLFS